MKKQFLIFLTIGVILLTIGAVGAASLFGKVEKEMKVVVDKNYQPKTADSLNNVTLTVNGETGFIIMPSEDDQFHLQNTFYNIRDKRQLDWRITDEKDKLDVNVNFTQQDTKVSSMPLITLGFWQEWTNTIILVPKTIKHLTIKSNTHHGVNVNNLTIDDLTVDVANHLSVDSIKATNLQNTGQDSTLSLSNSRIKEKVNLQSKQAALSVSQTQFSDLELQSDSGTITLDKLIGKANVTTENGQVYINQVRGDTKITNQNGGVEWNPLGATFPLSIATKTGTITANLQNKQENVDLRVSTKEGTIYQDGEVKKEIHLEKGSIPVKLTADRGTIDVNFTTYFDHDDFDNDFD